MKNFTRTPNDLLMALCCSPLSKNELRVVIFIFRLSSGCNKERAIIIPRDFTTIGIQESQIGALLGGLETRGVIGRDKPRKEMWLEHEKLISSISFNEDRLADLLSKNLRKKKTEPLAFNKVELAERLSMDRPFLATESQETQPKDNKEQLKTAKTPEGDGYKAFKQAGERLKNDNFL
ncbi:MAG: replication protein [Patescibacteria group bacterium]|nr:replication protein [Patescibacteria group bacterium]